MSLQANTCNICFKTYQTKTTLKAHNQIVHLGLKINSCDVCEKSFMNDGHLQRHKLSHTGEKSLKCEYCDYKTAYTQDLNLHTTKIHTKDLPFHCAHCSQKFRYAYLLKKHLM